MLLSVLIVFFFLPETKGRSAAEIDEMFEAGVPAREFSSKHTNSTDAHDQLLTTM